MTRLNIWPGLSSHKASQGSPSSGSHDVHISEVPNFDQGLFGPIIWQSTKYYFYYYFSGNSKFLVPKLFSIYFFKPNFNFNFSIIRSIQLIISLFFILISFHLNFFWNCLWHHIFSYYYAILYYCWSPFRFKILSNFSFF